MFRVNRCLGQQNGFNYFAPNPSLTICETVKWVVLMSTIVGKVGMH